MILFLLQKSIKSNFLKLFVSPIASGIYLMKTILIFVSTLDGKITRWGDPMIRSWSSQADQDYFDAIWNNYRVIIMGSGTYSPAPLKPDSKHLYIILTQQPEKYKNSEVPGQLEFTGDSPSLLLEKIKKTGEETVLIVGGAKIATSFLRENLIDELWLTIEPRIFGTGGAFVTDEKLDIKLKLLSITKGNDEGTLLTKYKVLHV
jgi:dihydrofolate reductase